MKMKTKTVLKRVLSSVLAFVVTASMTTVLPVVAEEAQRYPYVIFAEDESTGVTINAIGLTVNGNVYTNGTFSKTSQYANVNGKIVDIDDIKAEEKTEEAFDVSSDMIYVHNKLTNKYFTENCVTYDESYAYSEMNVNLNNSIYVTGKLKLEGNLNLNNAVGAVSDVELSGGNINGNNTAIYSKFGDVDISASQVSVNGLIYAPFGRVTINSDNFNLNGIIIAQSLVINCKGNANINYSHSIGEIVGSVTEELNWTVEDWEYLADTDGDKLPNIIEKEIGTDPYLKDTDGDLLDDCYELFTTGTDPTLVDSDENGISDADEDFDEDGLSNLEESENETNPYNKDTDDDQLNDGEEVNTYGTNPLVVDTDEDGLDDGDEIYFGTDPLVPDTDGNGISDGDEKRFQTYIHEVENKDCAVTEVQISLEATKNLQKTTVIESIMGKDILCSDVVGLVGEPFSIETTSQFDKATITYVIDKSKLGDTEFDNLLFLWYDEENDEFVELDTILDEENSTVSVETQHFSNYMLVDQVKWFEAWKMASLYFDEHYEPLATVICYDCSGSMGTNDPTFRYDVYDENGKVIDSYYTNYRKLAIDSFIDSMKLTDKTALVSFENIAQLVSGFSLDKEALKKLVNPNHNGGTNAKDAIDIAIKELEDVQHWYTRHIILLTDGDVNVTVDQLNLAKSIGIKIHVISLGSYTNSEYLKHCASVTGGQYFAAATAEELEQIYKDLSVANQFDLSGKPDDDEDGLPDEFEVSGLVISTGKVIYTDPEIRDCDGDGLLDGEEVYINPSKSKIVTKTDKRGSHTEYTTVVFEYKSDPWEKDTDRDGLLDGEAQYYKFSNNENKMIAPVDPEPTTYNGLKNMWTTHIEEMKTGVIAHSYNSSDSGSVSKTNKWIAEQIVKLLLNAREALDFGLSKTKPILSFLKYLVEDTAEEGAYLLNFVHDEYGEIYHSKPETWQRQFGYNDFYDDVFRISSNMDYGRIEFNVGNKKYALWAWKGDYWNLQSGAEVGLYEYQGMISDTEHFDAIDFEVPMTLSLYNYFSFYDIRNLFNWMPTKDQWWITGFNTKHTNPDPDVMVSIVSIDLSKHPKFYEALKNTDADINYVHDIHKDNLIFDDNSKTVWLQWYT